MHQPSQAEFSRPKLSWVAASLSWLAGVEPQRLATHGSVARALIKATGIVMLMVSAPVACAAMGFYVYESMPGLPVLPRVLLAAAGGLAWAGIATVGIDRTLLIAADAVGIGRWWSWLISLVARAGLAALMASLFSDLMIEAQYAGISNQAAHHIALSTSEQDAARIAQLEGVPSATKRVGDLNDRAQKLEKDHAAQLAIVRTMEGVANRCDVRAQTIRRSLDTVRASTPSDFQGIANLEAELTDQRATCRNRRLAVTRQRDTYVTPLENEIASNNTARMVAEEALKVASERAADRSTALDRITRDGYASLSGRKVGFEAAKRLHPEVRRGALLWWLFFFVAELLPVAMKSVLLRNNPASAEAQADLAEEAGWHRTRALRAKIMEQRSVIMLNSSTLQDAMDDAMTPNHIAMEHLAGHRAFLTELSRAHRRQQAFAEAYPDLAGQAHQAYMAAVANALESLTSRKRGPWPAE